MKAAPSISFKATPKLVKFQPVPALPPVVPALPPAAPVLEPVLLDPPALPEPEVEPFPDPPVLPLPPVVGQPPGQHIVCQCWHCKESWAAACTAEKPLVSTSPARITAIASSSAVFCAAVMPSV